MLSNGQTSIERTRDVLFVLPPDVSVPRAHIVFRFPPLGPAVVAACIPHLQCLAFDLALDIHGKPIADEMFVLADVEAVERYLEGTPDINIESALETLCSRLEMYVKAHDFLAISVDRGSQIPLVAVLTVEIKKRWDKRIIIGGVAMERLRDLFVRTGAIGPDIITTATTPAQIRGAFATLLELPEHRRGPPIESNTDIIELVRGGMRKAPSPIAWPMPDFSIYDLQNYRRDAISAQFPNAEHYRGEVGSSLVLPYFFTFECQFSCAFCQTGGTQEHKDIAVVVRELALLSERWETREFLLFDTQINLHAPAFSRALLDARLDLRWSDSYRVRPSEPEDLDLMARAGCASLTIGVESASERVLKSMIKGHKPEQATEMIGRAHEREILLRVNLLAGYPGETPEELQVTCAWVRENAFAIDDLAPSSFYLTADSPLGRKPERYGVRLRGPRVLKGEGKFRKSPDSLMYDEIDGLTWEQREPLLEEGERSLYRAWAEGRGDLGPLGGLSPSTMLALRGHFQTKSAINEFIRQIHGFHRKVVVEEIEINRPPLPLTVPLQVVLLTPKIVHPKVARALLTGYRLVEKTPTFRAHDGDVLHAILFADGAFVVFRGSVSRSARGLAQWIMVEEWVGEALRLAAPDPRAEFLGHLGRLELVG
ncbi:MAG TPA: radical SAM protein, partial [Polyangium sp.]|nr:radical SAM protein [Polyangium sp.]